MLFLSVWLQAPVYTLHTLLRRILSGAGASRAYGDLQALFISFTVDMSQGLTRKSQTYLRIWVHIFTENMHVPMHMKMFPHTHLDTAMLSNEIFFDKKLLSSNLASTEKLTDRYSFSEFIFLMALQDSV